MFARLSVGFLILTAFFFLNSCKQDTGSLGANVLPLSDKIGAYQWDTTSIRSSILLKEADSLPTDYASNSMLGSYNDPIFGETKTSLYIQVLAPVGAASYTSTPFPAEYHLDSMVLVLPFSTPTSYYGNLDPQTIEVFALDTPLVASHAYYPDTNLSYNKTPLAVKELTPNPFDSGSLLHIRLNTGKNTWARNLYNNIQNNYLNYFANFSNYYYGFYVTPSNPLQLPGQGGIWFMSFPLATGGLYVYYSTGLPLDTEFSMGFSISAGLTDYFTNIEHNYATASFYNKHPSGKFDSIYSPSYIYVQSGGVEGKITFPYLMNWAKLKPVLINQAELIFTVNEQDIGSYAPPANLFVFADSGQGTAYPLIDQNFTYYGGAYTPYTYTFNITQYIQQVIDGKIIDHGLYVSAHTIASANRVVLYGAQAGTYSVQLRMYYTPLKK